MRLEQLAISVESDWAQSALARIESDDDIGMSPLDSLLPLMFHTRILQHLSLARLRRTSGQFLKRSSSRQLCSYNPFSPPSLILTL